MSRLLKHALHLRTGGVFTALLLSEDGTNTVVASFSHKLRTKTFSGFQDVKRFEATHPK
jgi:hypothetical protein